MESDYRARELQSQESIYERGFLYLAEENIYSQIFLDFYLK